jgi:hypothetical protein
MPWAGYYFPHDEFYDASMRDVMVDIASRARNGARVASESPSLAAYYAEQASRPDLVSVSLSDPDGLKQLDVGDFVILARGRRYFSNDKIYSALIQKDIQVIDIKRLGSVQSARIYQLDQNSLAVLKEATTH